MDAKMEAGKCWAICREDGRTEEKNSPVSSQPRPNQLNPDHNNSCNSTIARLERVDADELFVSPLTLQSFTCEF